MEYEKIKNIFIDFFKKKKHKIYPSFPICLNNDNSSNLFVNSGMNHFKDYFLGHKIPYYPRVANIQRCIRVTGKHNDFEQVGYDNYHHTMFEMMGNWSFGDYSREKAIEWAWELLINVYGISKNDIYITIFQGDDKDKLSLDKESLKYWRSFIHKDHILFFGKKDNFWEMGDHGPCGPCTEIHVDLRNNKEKSKLLGKNLINKNHPKVIEIWNIVFIEYSRKLDSKLESLPIKHVDTGMGLERLCMVLQNKSSSYQTDIFFPIIDYINNYIKNNFYKTLNLQQNISIQIVVDHLRAIIFSIYDGQIPSNKESGYIVRKILRRAIIHVYFYLKIKIPFIYIFADLIIKKFLPKNINKKKYIINIIRDEESSFINVIKNGCKKISHIIKYNKEKKEKIIDGNVIFKLHDTYGFPIEISKILIKKHNLLIDEKTFKKKLLEQKNKSRKYNNIIIMDSWVYLNKNKKFKNVKNSFIGYHTLNCKICIIQYRKIFNKLEQKNYYELVFDRTPFYPEKGGQIGDTGIITNNDQEVINIINTKVINDTIIHTVNQLPIHIKSTFNSFVDKNRRVEIECNHTATHLLYFSLKKILGNHIEQKGSYIDNDYLRFDFSHNEKISYNKLIDIENFVQELIFSSISIEENSFSSIEIKKNIPSLNKEILKEKYKKHKKLRIISFGNSHEFCIGTHVKNTGLIQVFKILTENSISYGIRRIKAVTYKKAIKYLINSYNELNSIRKKFNCYNITKMIFNLKNKNKDLSKKISGIYLDKIKSIKNKYKTKMIYLNNIKYICHIFSEKEKEENKNENFIKKIGMDLIKKIPSLFMFTGFIKNGKYFIFVFISDNIIKIYRISANEVMNKIIKNKYGVKSWGKNNFSFVIGENKNDIKSILDNMMIYIEKTFNNKK
ncbi:alanine--tRNA ligase [Blattabacterium cuenoti]|uniref:alanine--tRNA ligase n=1 Tax=Blattabacterium cuenoti TaxID=1653831 RepID=UPI00163C2FB7|nr:alanine--tRNA ligase [Blattabacterium cuenoti]